MIAPRVTALVDPGLTKYPEDRLTVGQKIFAVTDGISGTYDREPVLYNGQTGGQVASDLICQTFSAASRYGSLTRLVSEANAGVRDFAAYYGIPINRADLLPGACLAAARLGENSIELVQAGDCLVLWQTRAGEIGFIPIQGQECERERMALFVKLLRESEGDKGLAWQKYAPEFSASKCKFANTGIPGGYAVLNGQPGFDGRYQQASLPANDLALILLLTDGLLVPEELLADLKNLAGSTIRLFWEGGLEGIAARTRQIEAPNSGTAHTSYLEGVGIALNWRGLQ